MNMALLNFRGESLRRGRGLCVCNSADFLIVLLLSIQICVPGEETFSSEKQVENSEFTSRTRY